MTVSRYKGKNVEYGKSQLLSPPHSSRLIIFRSQRKLSSTTNRPTRLFAECVFPWLLSIAVSQIYRVLKPIVVLGLTFSEHAGIILSVASRRSFGSLHTCLMSYDSAVRSTSKSPTALDTHSRVSRGPHCHTYASLLDRIKSISPSGATRCSHRPRFTPDSGF